MDTRKRKSSNNNCYIGSSEKSDSSSSDSSSSNNSKRNKKENKTSPTSQAKAYNAAAIFRMNYHEQLKHLHKDNFLSHYNDYYEHCEAWKAENDYCSSRALAQFLREPYVQDLLNEYACVEKEIVEILNVGCGRKNKFHDQTFAEVFARAKIYNCDIVQIDEKTEVIDKENYGKRGMNYIFEVLSNYDNEVNNKVRAKETYKALDEQGMVICLELTTSVGGELRHQAEELEKVGLELLYYGVWDLDGHLHDVIIAVKSGLPSRFTLPALPEARFKAKTIDENTQRMYIYTINFSLTTAMDLDEETKVESLTYAGQTNNEQRRKKEHHRGLVGNKHSNENMQKAFDERRVELTNFEAFEALFSVQHFDRDKGETLASLEFRITALEQVQIDEVGFLNKNKNAGRHVDSAYCIQGGIYIYY